eukprot:TRINITY_DN27105_c0_g1_i2.p1 TRINITY_DN27105_c0_g1~~TRINITY_DN27105_c0_g1_i2.p1  ORF type:complete len:654 (-),score=95.87 TRINITY_DN27105_c0_g1_i2:39-2000(-)
MDTSVACAAFPAVSRTAAVFVLIEAAALAVSALATAVEEAATSAGGQHSDVWVPPVIGMGGNSADDGSREGWRNCRNTAHRRYCSERCIALESWLSMGLGFRYGPTKELIKEYDVIDLWAVCPNGWFGMAAQMLRKVFLETPLQNRDVHWPDVEYMAFRFFATLNLTRYFHPMQVRSAAPFHHLDNLMRALTSERDGATPAPAVAQVAAPPTVSPNVSNVAPGCSLSGLVAGLQGAAEELRAAEEAFFDGLATRRRSGPLKRLRSRFSATQTCLEHLATSRRLVPEVLAESSPLFRILDKIDMRTPVAIHREPEYQQNGPLGWTAAAAADPERPPGLILHLLPSRDFESTFVRSYGRLHCDIIFKDALARRHAAAMAAYQKLHGATKGDVKQGDVAGKLAKDPIFNIVEVGAYLGGCSFWALLHLPSVRVVAVEAFAPAAEAMSRTARSSGLRSQVFSVEGNCISDNPGERLHRVFMVGADGGLLQPGLVRGESTDDGEDATLSPRGLGVAASSSSRGAGSASPASPAGRPCVTLTEVLKRHRKVNGRAWDLLRVHTSGMELPILRSGFDALKDGLVRTVVVVLTTVHGAADCEGLAEVLLGAKASRVDYDGRPVRDRRTRRLRQRRRSLKPRGVAENARGGGSGLRDGGVLY